MSFEDADLSETPSLRLEDGTEKEPDQPAGVGEQPNGAHAKEQRLRPPSAEPSSLLPTPNRDLKRVLAASPASGGGALAMLARSSLAMGLGDANKSSTSLNQTSTAQDLSMYEDDLKPGESSNIIIGPDGHLIPRSSILLNPMSSKRKTFVEKWRLVDDANGVSFAPAVVQIPVVPSAKDREAERLRQKREREYEIEREWREKEQAEKVWGIPKKAFYMGLGEINFNAQMAMLAGWGNGSGGLYDFRPTPQSALNLRSSKKSSSKSSKPRKSSSSVQKRTTQNIGSAKSTTSSEVRRSASRAAGSALQQQNRNTRTPRESQDDSGSSDSDESMDLEELASLNAIINTRRSMEAAQLLAKGQKRPISEFQSASYSGVQPVRKGSTDKPSARHAINGNDASNEKFESASLRTQDGSPSPRQIHRSATDRPQMESARIRFAPLPSASGLPVPPSPIMRRSSQTTEPSELDHGRRSGSLDMQDRRLNDGMDFALDAANADPDRSDEKSIMSERSDAASDSDEPDEEIENRRVSVSSMTKRYLRGMSKGMFAGSSSRKLKRSSVNSAMSAVSGELGSSAATEARLSGQLSDSERPGRRRRRSVKSSSRASSVKSRSSSVGSFDEDDRMRRRQLIRASRPGGTGMVTLPDGSRIRARRVGEEGSDDDLTGQWGFARLVREAQRQQRDGEGDENKTFQVEEDLDGFRGQFEEAADDTASTTVVDTRAEAKEADENANIRVSSPEYVPEGHFERTANEADGITSAMRRRRQRERAASLLASSHTKSPSDDPKHIDTVQHTDESEPVTENVTRANNHFAFPQSPTLVQPRADEMDDQVDTAPSTLQKAESGRAPKRSTTLPTGPMGLSASQAAEVRRRHEREVLALGNEVLENIAKARRARQQQQQQQSNDHNERSKGKEPQQGSHGSLSIQTSTRDSFIRKPGPMSPQLQSVDGRAEHSRERRPSARPSQLDEQNHASLPHRQRFNEIVRSSATRRDFATHDGDDLAKDGDASSTADGGAQTPGRRRKDYASIPYDEPMRSVTTTPSPNASRRHSLAAPIDAKQSTDLSNSIASLRSLRRADDMRQGQVASPLAQSNKDSEDEAGDAVLASNDGHLKSAADGNGRRFSANAVAGGLQQAHIQNKIRRHREIPYPHELPRRPDQRGYAVVPLPYDQLGRRPERPMHGRFWQTDADDSSSKSEEEDWEQRFQSASLGDDLTVQKDDDVLGEDEEESEDELNADELAEEERRTAQQKKRLTTLAAGAELVRSTVSQRKVPGSPDGRSTSEVFDRRTSEVKTRGSSTPKWLASPASDSSNIIATESATDGIATSSERDLERPNGTCRPSVQSPRSKNSADGLPLRHRDAHSSGKRSASTLETTKKGSSSESDDDAELWPPTLATVFGTSPQLSPMSATIRRKSSDSRVDGLHRTPSRSTQPLARPPSPTKPAPSLNDRPSLRLRATTSFDMAAHAAKSRAARLKRAAAERAAASKAKNSVNEDSIDYGWPKSLQGSSLY